MKIPGISTTGLLDGPSRRRFAGAENSMLGLLYLTKNHIPGSGTISSSEDSVITGDPLFSAEPLPLLGTGIMGALPLPLLFTLFARLTFSTEASEGVTLFLDVHEVLSDLAFRFLDKVSSS